MEFPVRQQKVPSRHSEEDKALAYRFSARAYKELDKLCKAIVLFGSVTQIQQQPVLARTATPGDIDILIIIDDVSVQLSDEMLTAYRLITEQCIKDVSTRIHVTTVKFTTFWEYMRVADPVMLNVLRTGVALIDTGFFEPMQHLLREGRIRPSTEAIWAYYLRAPQTLQNSQGHIMQATLDLYWAVIDAAHAAIMAAGQTPPSPRSAAELLRKTYVEKGLLEEQYAQTMEQFYALSKDIMNRRVSHMSADYYDQLYSQAKAFVDRMKAFLPTEEPTL
jgi:uncharacterized protein (UPF0332 family)